MTAIILEDEPLIARELQHKIAAVAPDLDIQAILPSLKTAKKWLMQHAEPDLLFLDIQLGDGTSFELFEQFDLRCPIIFTTAYDTFAVQAFRVNGADYLLKPVDEKELAQAIERCRQRMETPERPPAHWQELVHALQQGAIQPYKEKFLASSRGQWLPVRTADIACFLRDQLNYLLTFSGERFLLDYNTLEEIEDLLDPRLFYRANRQYIIHVDAIQSVKPLENQKLIVQLKAPLQIQIDISREKAPGFRRWLDR